jgi:hypothetical protein
MFTKLRVVLATTALGAVALLGIAACDSGTTSSAAGAGTLTAEETALTALGIPTTELGPAGTPTTDPSAAGKRHPKAAARLKIRRALGRDVEHGEVVVQTKDGDKTVDVQRGAVTAINDTTVTVKSADGYTLTWKIGSSIRVIEHRTTVQPKDVTTGAQVGIAGTKDGSTVTATLIVIPNGTPGSKASPAPTAS